MKKTLILIAAITLLFSCSKDDNFTITNLTVSDNQEKGRLELSWDQGDCETVVVYRSVGDAEPVEYGETRYYERFYDEDIIIGETYNYKIVSTDPSGVASNVVSIVCPKFEPMIKEINMRQDGHNILIDWSVKFCESVDGLSLSVYRGNSSLVKVIDLDGTYQGTILDAYAASPESYNYYNIYLKKDGETIDSEDYKFYTEHTYALAPSNVKASIISSSDRTIRVSWDAASDAEGYVVESKVGNTTYTSDGTAETSVDLQFPADAALSDGTIIEITVTGFATFNGTQYTSDSETIELKW